MPKTASAPLIGSKWNVTVNWWPWRDSEVSGQTWLQSRTESLPTKTWRGLVFWAFTIYEDGESGVIDNTDKAEGLG